jgi:hypothetical protein
MKRCQVHHAAQPAVADQVHGPDVVFVLAGDGFAQALQLLREVLGHVIGPGVAPVQHQQALRCFVAQLGRQARMGLVALVQVVELPPAPGARRADVVGRQQHHADGVLDQRIAQVLLPVGRTGLDVATIDEAEALRVALQPVGELGLQVVVEPVDQGLGVAAGFAWPRIAEKVDLWHGRWPAARERKGWV